jgi:ribonuclease III
LIDGLPKVLQALPQLEGDAHADADDESVPPGPGGLDELQTRLGYRFRRPELLRAALTLGSWANEHPDAGWPSNACLEFFGDAVLDLLAADAVWRRFPDLGEGELTRLRASIVSERCLGDVAGLVDLGEYLWLGRGDVRRGQRRQASTLADAIEAVLGAVFLDAREAGDPPLAAAGVVFERLLAGKLADLRPDLAVDPKTSLQHWAQARYRITPVYVRIDAREPENEGPRWRARVELRFPDGRIDVLGEGEGESLRRAERRAARAALDRIAAHGT